MGDFEKKTDPDRSKILNLYAAFGVGLALSLAPHGLIALVAMMFLIGVLAAAYAIRKKSSEESLAYNHALYIIRTIGIGTLISVLTVSAGGFYMLWNVNYDPFQPCAAELGAKGAEFAQNATYEEVFSSASPCFDQFISGNFSLFVISGLIAALPVLVYFAVRYARGLSRAIKGYRLADPKIWF